MKVLILIPVMLVLVYWLVWCRILRAEAKRIKRKVYYDYFSEHKNHLGKFSSVLPDVTPDPVNTSSENSDDEPWWQTLLFIAIMTALILICAHFSKP